MKESSIYRAMKEYAASHRDVWLQKYHGGPMSMRGHPDVYGCVGPYAFFVELKAPGKKASKLQSVVGRRIIEAGAMFEVVDDARDFIWIVNELRSRNNGNG